MKSTLSYLLIICSLFTACIGHQEESLLFYVDTRTGTAPSATHTAELFGKNTEEYGQTLPAVLEPNGMNFWTPQTQDTEAKCKAPYYYKDTKIQGFRNSHWIVGGCTQDYGSMTLMPVSGTLKYLPQDRGSLFSHQEETATPAYYSVLLKDYSIFAEMTGRSRSAIFRFTYNQPEDAYLIVNPNSDEGKGYIEIDTIKKQIRGYNPVHRIYQGWGEPAGYNGYFIIEYQNEIEEYGTFRHDSLFAGQRQIADGTSIGAYLRFKIHSEGPILIKAASSFTDMEGAQKNLDTEIPHWDFDRTRQELNSIWEQRLSQVTVQTNNRNDKEKFYGALYRASFLPRTFNDVDGRYPSFSTGHPFRQSANGRNYYEDYSMWDTYRALHPLVNILTPKKAGDMMQSLVDKYEQGGWLPIFPCWNSYTAAMIGDHCISALGDAYIKGIRNFDINKACEGMLRNAFRTPATYEEYKNGMGRRALNSYLKYGYIPLEDSVPEAFHTCEQVSRTLEYAYDDFVLAQVLQKLETSDDYFPDPQKTGLYDTLMIRARYYRNVINPSTGYAQGRYADGSFLTDAGNAFSFTRFITEGAPCHYTWYAPHDIYGLMECMGGKEKYIAKLDSMFHPLVNILTPKKAGDMMQSLVDKYEQGGWLPIFPCWNSYTAAMIGDHCISALGDAYIKGIRNFDINKACEGMLRNAFRTPATYEEYKNGMGRRALNSYLKYGYIPLEDSVPEAFHTCEQVSRTLEYAYDDFVLAQVLQKLETSDDYFPDPQKTGLYDTLMIRARYYRNVINPSTGYAQGRYADGSFLTDAGNAFSFTRFITEGAPCHYTWYAPHDIYGLMECMGGKEKYIAKLDSMFSEHRYWHGNEPCHQIAYLFNYAGQPWKTQREVRHIMETEYLNAPGGLSGNDDAGQMSAWYVFSAMGFYPVCPGTPYYIIGSPSFPRMSIRLENGKTFTILAHNANKKNIYIQSAKLNGKEYDKNYFTHQDIVQGGTLEFQMGPNPNTNWGASALSLPPDNMK